jgi:hypothetical protein
VNPFRLDLNSIKLQAARFAKSRNETLHDINARLACLGCGVKAGYVVRLHHRLTRGTSTNDRELSRRPVNAPVESIA